MDKSMTLFYLTVNLISLVVGAAAVALVYRMDREYRLPRLHDFLIFVVCAVISGFFDWIAVNLMVVMLPRLSPEMIDAVFHLFWDLIGFPCALAAAAFLLFTLAGFLRIPFGRRQRVFISLPFLFLVILSVFGLILRMGFDASPLSSFLWRLFTLGLPLYHILLLGWAYVRARLDPDPSMAYVRHFFLFLFFGFFVWHALSIFPSRFHPAYHLSILWFFMALLPPTLYLRTHLHRTQRRETLEVISRDSLKPLAVRFHLTEREQDVLLLLMKGKSYSDMKEELFVSFQTVKNYISRIYKKAGVRNRVELVNLVRNTIQMK